MASEKFGILLENLLSKTRKKDIRWHETADEYAFRIALGDGLVRIEYTSIFEGQMFYVAYLQNRTGRTLDQIGPFEQGESELLSELFDAARISALGSDDILDSMIKDVELGKTQPLPREEEKDDLPF